MDSPRFTFKETADSGCELLSLLGSSKRARLVPETLPCPLGLSPGCGILEMLGIYLLNTILFNFITLTRQGTCTFPVQRKIICMEKEKGEASEGLNRSHNARFLNLFSSYSFPHPSALHSSSCCSDLLPPAALRTPLFLSAAFVPGQGTFWNVQCLFPLSGIPCTKKLDGVGQAPWGL